LRVVFPRGMKLAILTVSKGNSEGDVSLGYNYEIFPRNKQAAVLGIVQCDVTPHLELTTSIVCIGLLTSNNIKTGTSKYHTRHRTHQTEN